MTCLDASPPPFSDRIPSGNCEAGKGREEPLDRVTIMMARDDVMRHLPTVSDILADPSRLRTRYARSRGSPSLFSRLLCRSHPDWAISSIPEPVDDANPDPICCAILAVLTQLMCDAFNRRVGYGLPRDAPPIVTDFAELAAHPKVFEETPEWAKRVKPLDERFYIPNRDGKVLNENDKDISEEFKAMNIIVQTPFNLSMIVLHLSTYESQQYQYC